MPRLKTNEEIEILREGGHRLARILRELADMVVPGERSDRVDARAFNLAAEYGDRPAFLHYQPAGAPRPFPGSVCVSVNEEIVHGIPNEDPKVFREGDVVKLDFGLVYEGLVTDSATTVGVGTVSNEAGQLMEATHGALDAGIDAATVNGYTGDIGAAIETYVVDTPFHLVKELAGHGVGYEVHEEPLVPNVGTRGTGQQLVPGFVFAVEPMLTIGSAEIVTNHEDGFTISTKDGSLSAQEEHTVAVTDAGIEILTAFSDAV